MRRHAKRLADLLNIGRGIVIILRRRPAGNNLADGIQATAMISQQVDAQRTNAVRRLGEGGEANVVAVLLLPLEALAAFNIAGVVIADTANMFTAGSGGC